MKWKRMLTLSGVHCEGEVGRVITGGIIDIPGKTMLEKMLYINNEDDWLRRFTLYEPRGCAQMSVNVLLPPTAAGADAGFIVLQPDAAHALSGSNTMCVTTAILETGILPMAEPCTKLTFDTPAGLIPVTANCRDGKVESVTIDICPSFAEHLDLPINVPGIGRIVVDVGFGGCYFAICDIRQLGLQIDKKTSRKLVEMGSLIKQAVDEQVTVQHPTVKEFNHVDYVMFTDQHGSEAHVYKNSTILPPGRVDRSPCGTGSSARMAVLYAKGLLRESETVFMESIIGGRFKGEIARTEKMVDGRVAIIPRLTGRCWIYSLEQLGVDPTDPFPNGYTMSDTWGPDVKDE